MSITYNNDGSVCVKSLLDIREVIKNVMPGTESKTGPDVKAEFVENGKKIMVSAPSKGSNDRDLLMQGFDAVKARMEVIARVEGNSLSPVNIDGRMWLDDFLKRRLGAVRDGLRAKWEISEGIFMFDPYTGKLTKC